MGEGGRMKTLRNPIELASGNISGQVIIDGEYVDHILDSKESFYICDSSDWTELKMSSSEEKEKFKDEKIKNNIKKQLESLDVSPYILSRAICGDQEAIEIIKETEKQKLELRAKL